MYYLIKWWQITYYNVGSFRLKLHSLKLDLRLSLSLPLSLRLLFFKVRFRFCIHRNLYNSFHVFLCLVAEKTKENSGKRKGNQEKIWILSLSCIFFFLNNQTETWIALLLYQLLVFFGYLLFYFNCILSFMYICVYFRRSGNYLTEM